MICTEEDEVEKMLPSEEEQEKEEDETEDGDEEAQDEDEEEEEGGADEEREGGDAEKAAEKKEEKKEEDGLNLNNEVVKMRKEVKRVRALIIRKLTRQIGALKKKKGKETEIERNTRRANRLLEEIHAMKCLVPDLVTKTALQKNLNFEQECKNPQSTISDRAVARIATHPQFSKKIENIKSQVKAFKLERMKIRKPGGKEKLRNEAGKATLRSPDKNGGKQGEKEEEGVKEKQKEIRHAGGGDGIPENTTDVSDAEPQKKTGKATHSADVAQRKETPKIVKPALIKSSEVKDTVKNKPQSQDVEKKQNFTPKPEVPQKTKDDDQSDLESSDDEEKEYFDDSTEERFHKQSSQSEESDDGDDFFVGKVSKFKKKKKKKQESAEGESVKTGQEVKADPVQSQLDELESRLKSKVTSLHSVFCSSLSSSKPGGGRGAHRGRGGDKFRGQGKPKGGSGLNRDFSKQSKFQKQERRTETNSGSPYSKPESSERGFSSVGRGRGRGRGDAIRQKDHMGRGGGFSGQAPQQALHPSWEASKKRKEQQGQILAFQGKKIKFDDD